jgi:hypothetical protein
MSDPLRVRMSGPLSVFAAGFRNELLGRGSADTTHHRRPARLGQRPLPAPPTTRCSQAAADERSAATPSP